MPAGTINTALAKSMAQANAVQGASIVGRPGGWSVYLKCGPSSRALAAQRSQQVRLWRSLDRCVEYLKNELGIARIDLLDSRRFSRAAPARQRKDASERMRATHRAAQYDAWLRSEIAAAIADPRPSIANTEVKVQFAKKRAALRKRVLTGRGRPN